ncbi:MAG: hypothetical protein ACLFPS_04540 [Clostridia bacterium]
MKKLVTIIALLLLISGCTEVIVPSEDFSEENQQLAEMLPNEEGFEWIYNGFAEYGHTMTLDSISGDDEYKEYIIGGTVYDASGGEAEGDYSLEVKYEIEKGELRQYTDAERMMDPSYQGLILLKSPLTIENSWEQTVELDGEEITLDCHIAEERETDQGIEYIVMYEDIESDYYEIRKFREGYGLVSFEKLYQDGEEDFEISYHLYESSQDSQQTIINQEVSSMLPNEEGFEWIYSGFAEYGHTMELTDINFEDDTKIYTIQGEVFDASGGEATGDFSVSIEYYIRNGELRQSVTGERLMEPQYQDMILIKYPFNIGTSWQQTVVDLEGNEYEFECQIDDLSVEDDKWVYHVIYEDVNSDYYEIREFMHDKGVVAYTKLIELGDEMTEVGYRLNNPSN